MTRESHKLFDLHVPLEGTSYERLFEAETDCLTANEILVRGRMRDHRFDFAHEWIVRTPDYEILDAKARHLTGDPERFDPELCEAYRGIKGIRIGRGFSSRVMHTLGHAHGNREHLLLAIEMARAGQQIYQIPPELDRRVRAALGPSAGLPQISWTKDREYMSDLIDSCYTYRDESAALFTEREVRCGFDPEITGPKPGDKRVFWRHKRLTISTETDPEAGAEYRCENHMQDRVHDIKIGFEILPDGTIIHAQSRGLRLPYHGICESPHLRTPGLNGLRVTSAFVAQFAEHIGGASGCTHLFDLSIDCLRLFKFHQ